MMKGEAGKGKEETVLYRIFLFLYGQHDSEKGPLELIRLSKRRKNKAGRRWKSKQWPKGKEDSCWQRITPFGFPDKATN